MKIIYLTVFMILFGLVTNVKLADGFMGQNWGSSARSFDTILPSKPTREFTVLDKQMRIYIANTKFIGTSEVDVLILEFMDDHFYMASMGFSDSILFNGLVKKYGTPQLMISDTTNHEIKHRIHWSDSLSEIILNAFLTLSTVSDSVIEWQYEFAIYSKQIISERDSIYDEYQDQLAKEKVMKDSLKQDLVDKVLEDF